MAKGKGQPTVQNRHLYSRISYLYQAAKYLSTTGLAQQTQAAAEHGDNDPARQIKQQKATQNVSRQLVSDLRGVSRKVTIRQSPNMKRSMCKHCDTFLEEGKTCISAVENMSKGGRKPWADVLTIRCLTCGHTKRFPISARKQKRKELRAQEVVAVEGDEKTDGMDPIDTTTT